MGGQPGTLDPGVLFKVRGFVKTDGAYAGGVDFKRVLSHPSSSLQLAQPATSGRENVYFYYKCGGRALRRLVIKCSQPNSAEKSQNPTLSY